MDKLNNSYDRIVSLGSTCCIKAWLRAYNIEGETNFYDWVGSSMWGIVKLLEDPHNETIFDINHHKYIRTLNSDKNYMVVNTYIYLILMHEFPSAASSDEKLNITLFTVMKDTYSRRLTRFVEMLNNSNKLLFIRQEQNISDRIMTLEQEQMFATTELEYLITFTKLLKTKYPTLKFDILFFSHSNETCHLPEHNIIILHGMIGGWDTCTMNLTKTFMNNMKFIDDTLFDKALLGPSQSHK